MRLPVAVVVIVAVGVLASGSDKKQGPTKPTLVVLASPRMSQAGIGSVSPVTVTAVLAGPEDERFYCPQVVFIAPDGTESSEESGCAPFEQRNECWPARPPDARCLGGWHRGPDGGIVEDPPSESPKCSCTITGYPRRWKRVYGVGTCPYDGVAMGPDPCGYTVSVELRKNGKLLARQPSPTFYVR
jgi:hypothetical protein